MFVSYKDDMNEPHEDWRALREYPEYEVSTLGRVRNAKKGSIRTPDINSKGYARLRLVRQHKIIRKFVHRLVAETYLENPENKEMVDHINGDHKDNRLCNLRWTTRSENMLNGKVRKDKKHTTLRNIVKNGKWFRWKVCVGGHIHTSRNFATEQEAYADFLVRCRDLTEFVRLYPLPSSFPANV
jgi:hypothetical protein